MSPPLGPYSGTSTLALVARASAFTFGVVYGNLKLKYLKSLDTLFFIPSISRFGNEETTLEHTSTWAVVVVCFILIAVSILIEHGLHLLAKYLQRKRKKYVLHVLSKIKSDLLLLGFISLMLTGGERPLAKICFCLYFLVRLQIMQSNGWCGKVEIEWGNHAVSNKVQEAV
ncbi:unnamed protein product [Coffea canephora]|uniref:Uncharacterized protein n=1 Tax=Coffea canephora TaxID=49390 RepID=A0A068VAK5_COFCA|nr:unnamed protein product [Coffea canephora]